MTTVGTSEKDEAVATNVEIKLTTNKLSQGRRNVENESDVLCA
jgi:hypothetical protein